MNINNKKFFKINDLKSWIHKKSQPNDYLFIGKNPINAELLEIIADEPIEKYDKSKKVFQFLDSFFDSVQWTNTFSFPHVIYYDEFITPEIIFYLHRYLSKKCADIESVYIIDSHQHGISLWWEKYKEVMQIKSFNFIEIGFEYANNFFNESDFSIELNHIQNIDILKEKNILYTFSFYGGTYYSECRNFLFLLFNYYGNNNPVDKIFNITDKKSTLDYCEQITNFKYQEMIDFIEERWNADRECCNLITEKKENIRNIFSLILIKIVLPLSLEKLFKNFHGL